MNELKEYQAPENAPNTPPPKKGINPYVIIGIVAAFVSITIAVLAFLYAKTLTENKKLSARLELMDIVITPPSSENNPIIVDEKSVVTSTQIKAQLNSVKKLITKEYIYTGAAKQEANKKWIFGWDMPFSDTTLVIMYDGTIIAGVDLNKINPAINEETRTITILVPKATILSHDLPQETIRIVDQKESLFNDISLDEYNKFVASEKPKREQDAIDRGLLTEATNEAKMVIEEFLQIIPGMGGYTLIVK
ncbi:MAG: DUF4230 domain-containing protein [Oscillospiraceae bacterium]|nr:DUF4230 domain-containing protein [Oscillospiraceae bacterium]